MTASRLVGVAAVPLRGQPDEQLRYARWLERGARAGFVLLVTCFAAYVLELWPSHVPLARLPELWTQPVDAFRRAAGMPAGWRWLALVHRGDIANLVGITLLAGSSLPPLLALLPLYARRGERTFVFICQAEIVVLLFAASGLFSFGH